MDFCFFFLLKYTYIRGFILSWDNTDLVFSDSINNHNHNIYLAGCSAYELYFLILLFYLIISPLLYFFN